MRILRHCSTILCTILAVFVIIYSIFLPRIVLKGKHQEIINYKEKYVEKGYTAKMIGKDLTRDVKVEGKVNYNKLVDYKIKYIVNVAGIKFTEERIVKVRDTSKPSITLNGEKDTQAHS